MGVLILFLLGSLLVAYFGRDRTAGFWGLFFFSMLTGLATGIWILGPVISLLILVLGNVPSRPPVR